MNMSDSMKSVKNSYDFNWEAYKYWVLQKV